MSRAIHIFRKDAARLWPRILIFWATLILFAIEDPTYSVNGSSGLMSFSRLLYVLLPLACWLLVVGLIHEEKPIGYTQYWLTRPFSRRALLAADGLFLVAFVHVPTLVCQAIVLAANGFSPAEHITDLVAKQFFLAALLVLPMAALASVTKSLGHAFLGSLLVCLAMGIAAGAIGGIFPVSSWGAMEWIRSSAAALLTAGFAATILWIQYTWRLTRLSRSVLAAGVVAVIALWTVPPWQPAFTIQSWFSERTVGDREVRIVLDAGRQIPLAGTYVRAGRSVVEVDLPIRVDNLPAGLDMESDWIWVLAEGGGLKPWRPGETVSWHREVSGKMWLPLMVDADYFERAKDIAVHVSGTVDLTLLVPNVRLASFGECYELGPAKFDCLTLRPKAQFQQTSLEGNSLYYEFPGTNANAPYPTSPWFGPLQRFKLPSVNVKLERPVAHIERSFDFGMVRLGDYRVAVE